MHKAGIYIHMPFCRVKCMYCDFYSVTDKDEFMPIFFDSLIKEIQMCQLNTKNWEIDSIFIGGGTPSLMSSKQLENLIKELDDNFDLSHIKEFTIEANPGEAPEERLKSFKSLGVNRVSMGVQSLNEDLLKFLTRIHGKDEVLKTFKALRKVGFDNINCDLIFNIPNQTLQIWGNDLKDILQLEPEHLSCYSLTVEKGTQLYNYVNSGKVKMPSNDKSSELYRYTQSLMSDYGYEQYEISNWSKPKLECKHNLHYWEIDPCLAFGPSAHGFDGKSRFSNISNLDMYINKIKLNKSPQIQTQELSDKNYSNELIGFGLRIKNGINLNRISDELKSNFEEIFEKNKDKWGKFLTRENNRLRLTKEGYAFADAVAVDFLL
ncbi:MAG: radical SAM family heme chaperone HemW [Candidatus Neomarinimicrobiota bacterium]